MRVRFLNGTEKACVAPTEQKIFRNLGTEGKSEVWVLVLKLVGEMTSDEMDGLLSGENVSGLLFFDEEGEELAVLSGYKTISSVIIRHNEQTARTTTEIQLTKGVQHEECN